MLPIPFLKKIPKLFQGDTRAQALADKADTHIREWGNDAISFKRFRSPDEIPSIFLDELGFYLYAGLKNDDDDMTKRKKVATAVAGHKVRELWDEDIAPRIETITGILPELYNVVDTDDWIWMAKEATDPDRYWATWGIDGVDNDLGIWVVGAMDEFVIAGNIYIDLKSSTLTADQISRIVEDLKYDRMPAYYRIYLGYVSAGIFTVYAGGIIG